MIDREQQDLIAAMVAAPANNTPWLAYARWLDARGDRRGDVIRQSIACDGLTNGERLARLRSLYDGNSLMSPRLQAQAQSWSLGWWRGFIKRAHLIWSDDRRPTQDTVEALLEDPHAALLQSISMRGMPPLKAFADDGVAPPDQRTSLVQLRAARSLWWALLAVSRPTVRSLTVSGLSQAGVDRLDQLPALDMLDVAGHEAIGRMAHRRLRRLVCDGQPIAQTAELDLPELEELSCMNGGIPDAVLERPPPKLAMLVLIRSAVNPIAQSKLASQLRVIVVPEPDLLLPYVWRFSALRHLVVPRPRLAEFRSRLPHLDVVDDWTVAGLEGGYECDT